MKIVLIRSIAVSLVLQARTQDLAVLLNLFMPAGTCCDLTLKSHYLHKSDMVALSEYIQIAAAGIYATALFYTIVTFGHSKRLDQIGTLNGIMVDLRDLDRKLTKIP